MPVPFRWLILQALAESLRHITVARGYYCNATVEIRSIRLDQLARHQTIFLEPVSGSLRPRVLHDPLDRDHLMVIDIGAFLKGDSTVPLHLAMFQMEEDITRRLYEDDPTLGGLVKTIQRPEEDLYRLEGNAAADVGWLMKSITIHADET
jgi:hypothetical protein